MIHPILDIACHNLAREALFGGIPDFSISLRKHGLQYRKGKTAEYVREAVQKGLRAGSGRTELEISMVACYLSKVVKLA